jgi:hypothetical protein
VFDLLEAALCLGCRVGGVYRKFVDLPVLYACTAANFGEHPYAIRNPQRL